VYLVLVVVCVGVIHRAFVPFTDPGSAYQQYWNTRTSVTMAAFLSTSPPSPNGGQLIQDFHRHHEHLTQQDQTREVEDWQSELRHYLKVIAKDVSPETDVIEWWQVRHSFIPSILYSHILDSR